MKSTGDGFLITFPKASDALRFGVQTQGEFLRERWSELADGLQTLKVRIGIHTGEAFRVTGARGSIEYFGPAVNRAARLCEAGHGGQVLASEATHALCVNEIGEGITFRDLGRHLLRGIGQECIWQVCHPDLPSAFPPLRAPDRRQRHLPTPPTPFIGREAEVQECRDLLRGDEVRLLTLTGFGGMGKSRTALRVAEECADFFADGVWWVDLDAEHDDEGMLNRIANRLHVPLQPQPSVLEQVAAGLRGRRLLLVLDNLEQIPGADTAVLDLLTEAPSIKILATTRRALELQEERLLELKPLDPEDARRLFETRAAARRRAFVVNEQSARDIAQLCSRLDGHPLAIELAASRIVAMTPREILSRLHERFRLLQARSADLPTRHQALTAAIDWSYELLAPQERSLLAQLSVFAREFTLFDAEEVCRADDVFGGVIELVHQSLLGTRESAADQQTRYSMLESVREYASVKLAQDAEESEAIVRRHAQHFLAFAEERLALLRTPGEAGALAELRAHFDDLRAAVAWAGRQQEDPMLLARLARAFCPALHRCGHWEEARQLLRQAIEAAERSGPAAAGLKAELCYGLASVSMDTGNRAEAQQYADTSLALRRTACDGPGIGESLNVLGLLAMEEDLTRAHGLFEEALANVAANDHVRRGMILHNMGLLMRRLGDAAGARRVYEEALHHAHAAGHAAAEAQALGSLSILAYQAGEKERAWSLSRDSLAILDALGDRQGIAIILNNLAEFAEQEGAREPAVALLVHSHRIFRRLSSPHAAIPAESLDRLAAQIPASRFEELKREAEEATWESVVAGTRDA